jgi:hypothetical protein
MRKRGSGHARGNGGTNRQNAVIHHRLCIDPKPHRTVNGQMREDSGAFKTNQQDPAKSGIL